jgi:hypothetical protein
MSPLENALVSLKNDVENDRVPPIALVSAIFNKAMELDEVALDRIRGCLEGSPAIEQALQAWGGRSELHERTEGAEQVWPSRTEQAGQIIVDSMRRRRQSAFSYAEAEQCLADSPDLQAITGYGLWDVEKHGEIRKISRGRYELVL